MSVTQLEPSRLDSQLELLSDDLDLADLDLLLQGSKRRIPIREMVTDGNVSRTIEGASTILVEVVDQDHRLLKSGALDAAQIERGVDFEIDGLWFRLVAHRKQGKILKLTFEPREVVVLRSYPKKTAPQRTWWRSWPTSNVTRTQFARGLVDDVKELSIRFIATESKNPDVASVPTFKPKAEKRRDRDPGFAKDAAVTVQGEDSTREQRDNIARVIDVGLALGLTAAGASVGRLIIVAAVDTIIVETHAVNLPGGDLDSVGLFQQRPSQGWPASRDVETDAHAFYTAAIAYMKQHPNADVPQLAQGVQQSAFPERYAKWRTEAEHAVNAYFGYDDPTTPPNDIDQEPTSGSDGNLGFFTRGLIRTRNGHKIRIRESDWACLLRLAKEVQWRAFEVSGTIYFCSDGHLFQSAPRMTLSETSDGVEFINYEWDTGKRNATVTLTCRIGRWQAPPGSVVALTDSGPLDGRWLVATTARPLFSADGTITLSKPMPVIAEELTPEFSSGDSDSFTLETSGSVTQTFRVATRLVQPIPQGFDVTHGGVHQTDGLPGYPAIDFFAKPGTPVIAPENGTIERFSGYDPGRGPTRDGVFFGTAFAGGALGWSIYLKGDSGTTYYLTHLGSRTCAEGQRILAGAKIGTVADYDRWGRKSHVHVGVNGGPVSIEDLGDAPKAVRA